MTAIDPADYTISDVEAWVEANWHDHRNDSTVVAVHNSERDGKARVGLLDWLDHFAEDHGIDLTPPVVSPADPAGPPIALNPTSAVVGAAPLTLVVTGSGFTGLSGIAFNSQSVVTTFISATQVSAPIDPRAATVGDAPVWVVTSGVATQVAYFRFNSGSGTPGQPEKDLLTLQLRSWGIEGSPVNWAPPRWQATITAIRAYNLGFGVLITVQGLLDSMFPAYNIRAADVVVPIPTPPVVLTHSGRRASIADPGLPADHTTWYVDNLIVGHGAESPELTPGSHLVLVQVALAGSVWEASETFEVPA